VLFRQFKKLHEAEEDTSKVIEIVRQALVLHSTLEKEIFYPAIREAGGEEEEELLDEAEVEHSSVDQLLGSLRSRKLTQKKREATFTVLMEYVRHHVKEEENEMFPKVRKLKRLPLAKLGQRMQARRLALQKKMKMPPF
jgi:iron-sulfur cluster repair protein YtfE (RIC family)